MGIDGHIDLSAEHGATVVALLKEYLPGTTVWAYGSRVIWTSRDNSDLDLVAFATSEQADQVSALREAFEESDLPFRVDLFVWDEIPKGFRDRAEAQHVVLAASGRDTPRLPEWPIVRFEQLLTEPVRNGIYKPKEFHGRGTKIVNMGEIFKYPRLRAVPMRRVELSSREASRNSVEISDLLFARRSLVAEGAGKCSVVIDVDELTAFESSLIRARPDATLSDSHYLYYFFNSPSGLHRLDTIRRHVAVAGITGRDLAKIEFPIPPLSEQRAIAHVLGALDDRIELNRRMNETLEAMARALFKSWFVDFDPVRAKMDGCDPGLPSEIDDLFPDRLVDSELGETPKDWVSGCLADIADSPRRIVDPRHLEGDTPYIGLEHMPRRSVSLWESGHATNVTSTKYLFEKGEILFGKLRPYFHKVGIAPCHGVCSTDIVVITPKAPAWSSFVLACASSDDFVQYSNRASTGTKMPRTSWKVMRTYPLCLPPEDVVCQFQRLVGPWLDHLVGNIFSRLANGSLRDALLPKLVSGEARLPAALVDRCGRLDTPVDS